MQYRPKDDVSDNGDIPLMHGMIYFRSIAETLAHQTDWLDEWLAWRITISVSLQNEEECALGPGPPRGSSSPFIGL